jgi:protein kinase C substrate 80K-H
MDDEYDGYYGTDDYIPDHDHLVDGVDTADNEAVNDESSQGGKKKEFIDEVKATKFSSSRILFLDRAKRVIDEITVVLETPPPQTDSDGETDKDDQDDVSVEGDAHVESTMESESPKDNFDPTAYTMVRSELRKLESSILKGYNWAASAKLLFSFSEQSDHNLKRLAVGTLYYGQVSSLQLWQILQSILPEYAADGTASDGTCSSPWASSCPPKALPRKSEGETFPPKYILNAGAKFCDEQMVVLNSAMGGSCPASSSSSSEDGNMTVDIPSSIPDGYYGYSKPLSRTEDDPFTSLFSPIDSLSVDKDGLQELENKKKDLDKEKREIQNEVNNDWKDIGGKDGTEMGPDGELHVLANQCISVDAGKYTYETCIFGKATQRDIGQKVGGTGLGSWKGMSIDDESGRRVMTWDGGMKCWNGPQRSATVYISCGAETKLISADEPDTCRYVMEMESHIACDEAYRVANDL